MYSVYVKQQDDHFAECRAGNGVARSTRLMSGWGLNIFRLMTTMAWSTLSWRTAILTT